MNASEGRRRIANLIAQGKIPERVGRHMRNYVPPPPPPPPEIDESQRPTLAQMLGLRPMGPLPSVPLPKVATDSRETPRLEVPPADPAIPDNISEVFSPLAQPIAVAPLSIPVQPSAEPPVEGFLSQSVPVVEKTAAEQTPPAKKRKAKKKDDEL